MKKHIQLFIFCIFIAGITSTVHANDLKKFDANSLASIKESYANRPFLLVLWSLECPSCYIELDNLSAWLKTKPSIPLVLISTDSLDTQQEAFGLLSEYGLQKNDNWIFGSQAHIMLRQKIDPLWYGELPRSYLFDSQHTAHPHTGVLTKEHLKDIPRVLKSNIKRPYSRDP
ncbi:MAG: hypothetical protein COB62_04945 [Piscirickettsiaceae bacterium]|nr:MAG: hypothetical protein COB62_04945 [Piscirickettsiaceae bacterium]